VVFRVPLMFRGVTQLIAGIIQVRTGNALAGVLFSGLGAFWLSLFALAQWFLKDIPAAQVGPASGLFLSAVGIFIMIMFATSLRTYALVIVALGNLVFTSFFLVGGNYGATAKELAGHSNTLIHWGCYTGIAAVACLASAPVRAVRVLPRSSAGPRWPFAGQ
jgi:uncharacterized protein